MSTKLIIIMLHRRIHAIGLDDLGIQIVYSSLLLTHVMHPQF